MIRPYTPTGIPVYFMPHLEWELWGMHADGGARIVAGRERWPQMVFEYQVKPTILVTDPGPLDARVP